MFDRCIVINLDRRPERLRAFYGRVPSDWPFAPIRRVPAFDGESSPPPQWYGWEHVHRLGGAWGCFQSHLGVWKQALADGIDSVLIMEDDCVFCDDFSRRAVEFVDHAPSDDWDQIYFGGQHLATDGMPPTRVNDFCCLGRNVNRTHAYAIRYCMMEAAVERFDREWPKQHPYRHYHFDYQLGEMHKNGWRAYCPIQGVSGLKRTHWLCGQAAGLSDVNPDGKFLSTLWWNEFPIVEPKREAAAC